ncbi:hypothetical protein LCGC14_2952810 [marine sediment metagenome]|uniref:Uncharacterized protein n=1 Tax=marine sediment metagenome TaxID=412755 RepID=A0A0F8XFB0_9ZZZZ
MKTDILYVVVLQGGMVGLSAAPNIRVARQEFLLEQGTEGYADVYQASQEQIAWIRSMGGAVPPGRIARSRKTLQPPEEKL